MLGESIEAAGSFTSFWLFLFNRRSREAQVAEWREGGWLARTFMAFEATVAALIGAVIPVSVA